VRSKEEVKFATAGGPHNLFYQVFAESGFLGAGVLVFLTLLWLHSDLKNGNATKERTILTIILWTLFLTAQFNPVYAITFFTLCFTLRGLITES
jgi:O-antigen ligase